jgi:hypothetical protein
MNKINYLLLKALYHNGDLLNRVRNRLNSGGFLLEKKYYKLFKRDDN